MTTRSMRTATIALLTSIAAGGSAVAQVKTTAGLVQGKTTADGKVRVFLGIPYAAAPCRRVQVEGAAAGGGLAGRARGHGNRPALRAGASLWRHQVFAAGERGLSQPERLRARDGQPTAGDGMDSRRRLPGRRRSRAETQRRCPRQQGRGRRHLQLSSRCLRLPRASGADEGIGPQRVWQLRPPRSDRGAAVGEGQYRGVRRRSRQRDDLRRVRGIVCRQRADGLAGGGRTLPSRHRRKRRVLHGRRRHAGSPAARGHRTAGREIRRGDGRHVAGGAARQVGGRRARGRDENAAVVQPEHRRLRPARRRLQDVRRRKAGARAAARRLERRRSARRRRPCEAEADVGELHRRRQQAVRRSGRRHHQGVPGSDRCRSTRVGGGAGERHVHRSLNLEVDRDADANRRRAGLSLFVRSKDSCSA